MSVTIEILQTRLTFTKRGDLWICPNGTIANEIALSYINEALAS